MEEKIDPSTIDEIERIKYIFLNTIDVNIIKGELDHISDIHIVDVNKYGLLYWCWKLYNIKETEKELLLYLINRGIDINSYDHQKETLLIHTSRNGDFDTTELLIENGADVNHFDDNSDTALLWASYSNHLNIVKLLIDNDADVNHLYCDGRNAIMWASKRGNLDIVEYLSEITEDIMREDKCGDTIYTLTDNKKIKRFILNLLEMNRIYMYSWIEKKYYNHELFDKNIIKEILLLYQ